MVADEEDEDMKLARALSMETLKDTVEEPSKDSNANNAEKETPKSEKQTYPMLPEEPKVDKNLLCRVGVRLPDGRRLQRNFLRSDPIQVTFFDFDF